jgi:hypothetical protein
MVGFLSLLASLDVAIKKRTGPPVADSLVFTHAYQDSIIPDHVGRHGSRHAMLVEKQQPLLVYSASVGRPGLSGSPFDTLLVCSSGGGGSSRGPEAAEDNLMP